MKPPEILSLVEEAAGTSLYETKKTQSLKLMQKKENKVQDELPALEAKPSIDPNVGKTPDRDEYHLREKSLQDKEKELEALDEAQEIIKADQARFATMIEEATQKYNALRKKKSKEVEAQYSELEKQVNEIHKNLVSKESELTNKKKTVKEICADINKITKSIEDCKTSIDTNSKAAVQLAETRERLSESTKDKQAQLTEAQRTLQAIKEGINVDDADSSIKNQLSQAETKLAEATTQIKQLEMKRKDMDRQLNEHVKLLKQTQKESTGVLKEKESLIKEIEMLNSELEGLNYDGARENELTHSKKQVENKIIEYKDKLSRFQVQFRNHFFFEYRDPEINFDRRKVKGRLLRLFQFEDKQFALALENTAGGKLFQVVTQDEITSKQLIKRKCFDNRVIFIPNNKIDSRMAQKMTENSILSRYEGKARIALSYINYEPEFENSMRYAFGNTFVCENSSIAKSIAYDRELRTRCVNLEGDIFDPSGTVTGGSEKHPISILVRLQEVLDLEEGLEELEKEQREIMSELNSLKNASHKKQSIRNQIDLKNYQLQNIEKQIAKSSHQQHQDAITNLQENIEASMRKLDTLRETVKQTEKEVSELKEEIKEFTGKKKNQKELYDKKVKKLKKEVDQLNKELKGYQKKADSLEQENEDSKNEMESLEEQLEKEKQNEIEEKQKVETLTEAVSQLKQQYNSEKKVLEEKKKALQRCNKDLQNLEDEISHYRTQQDKNDNELKKLEMKLAKFNKDSTETREYLEKLIKEHPWIEDEKAYFGEKNTLDIDEARQRHRKVKDENALLEKRVNMKVDAMSDQTEKKFEELQKKKETIEMDKENIKGAIEELDEKKIKAIEKTWVKVNKDIGSIFSTLLPGAFAKLDPPEGSIRKGLELKVAFNNTWKQSLSELSGGQRSLLALSLVLALLLYKPAPMYILDEVDAALDLSHTQNIGQMISKHFPQSQFIVVSLKEGMFNNANVLFRTRFVDGVSTVERNAL
eukprot:CAMPEP_0115043136 /NCGR_PEP_ID=MMETSP0216-20121206/46684_1 /TAXON_ID=223996 /ORGANISM="Protocruzia adherens, Strain Boccale" /LENGTH=988 /DNA_ID=CAMNT_0002425389 /DNA_START=429 /DNA_END=3392 /DNA_ORIENTATION=+